MDQQGAPSQNLNGDASTMPQSAPESTPTSTSTPTPTWTYPTRLCRLCFEEVPASVTMYPPGLPLKFQRPIVEYRSEDEYGRLLRPCLCRGSRRYIHELCLLRSRTEVRRAGSLWKCHECGHQFSFQRLTIQKFLASKISSAVLTVVAMFIMAVVLGFIADPIMNLYFDPYDTLLADESYWREVNLYQSKGRLPRWGQHLLKGTVSMGLLGFLKTMLLNPFQWWNLRNAGFVSGRTSNRGVTGRDRTVNVHWLAILIGIGSAAYLFYKWVQAIIGITLQRIGNNVVDTHLGGDDDDLKPPEKPTHKEPKAGAELNRSTDQSTGKTFSHATSSGGDAETLLETDSSRANNHTSSLDDQPQNAAFSKLPHESDKTAEEKEQSVPSMLAGENISTETERLPSVLDSVHRQGWSFADI